MGAAAQARALKHFSVETMVSGISAVYEQVTAAPAATYRS
jgi:hypothetical protein